MASPIIWSREIIIASGYKPTGHCGKDGTRKSINRLAEQFNIKKENITAFCVAPGKWEYFFKPGATSQPAS